VSAHYGLWIESMVSILLLLTILYCVRLNSRLQLLRADEASLRATISELITATQIAERAIALLKTTVQEGERTLGERIARGEELVAALDQRSGAAETLLGKITRIAGAARAEEAHKPDAKALAAAAQAFAERTRTRLSGVAA